MQATGVHKLYVASNLPRALWYNIGTVVVQKARVLLPEIYSEISGTFLVAYADETEVPGVGVVSALCGVEDRVPLLPGFGLAVVLPSQMDARFGDNIHAPTQRSRSWQFS